MKTIYDTVHVTVIDTVHRVIADSVTLEALKNSQVFYNDSYTNLLTVAGILVTLLLAAYVGQYFTIQSQAGKILQKAKEQALAASADLLAAAKEEIDERTDAIDERQTIFAARMASAHALIGLKYCQETDGIWLGLFHYSLYCDICIENELPLSDTFLYGISEALLAFTSDEPHGQILVSLIDARKHCLSQQEEGAYELIVGILRSQHERYGSNVIEKVVANTRLENEEDEITFAEKKQNGDGDFQT